MDLKMTIVLDISGWDIFEYIEDNPDQIDNAVSEGIWQMLKEIGEFDSFTSTYTFQKEGS